MTTAATSLPSTRSADGLLRRAWRFSPLLTLAGLASLGLIPLFILAALVDPRAITGAPAWIKPLKFATSIAIFSATFLWLLTYVQGHARLVKLAASITGLGLLVETALIVMQVLRGTTSHFNVSTPFDAVVFSLMGGFITAVSVCTLLLAILLIRQRLPDRVFAWSLRLGLIVLLTWQALRGQSIVAPDALTLAALALLAGATALAASITLLASRLSPQLLGPVS